jgi:hypothetical protein
MDGDRLAVSAPTDHYGDGVAYIFVDTATMDETSVDIDIKPNSDKNVINPRSTKKTWVAVLSSEHFDALQVDPETVRFGPGGAVPDRQRVLDTNEDGFPDLKLRFAIPDLGLTCEVGEMTLTGSTYAGDRIVGTDWVQPKGCSPTATLINAEAFPARGPEGTVDLTQGSFYVVLMSRDGFDPKDIDPASVVLDDFSAVPRAYNYRDKNWDGVPDLRLRYKTKDVPLTCGEMEITVTAETVDGQPVRATLRYTVVGC